jgi:hypothetical protein
MKLELLVTLSPVSEKKFYGEGPTFIQAMASLERNIQQEEQWPSDRTMLDFSSFWDEFADIATALEEDNCYHLVDFLIIDDYCILSKA